MKHDINGSSRLQMEEEQEQGRPSPEPAISGPRLMSAIGVDFLDGLLAAAIGAHRIPSQF